MELIKHPSLDWKPISIVPVGDVQLGAGGVVKKALRQDIERGIEQNALFIGMGDYVDVASPSGRAKIKGADFYDSVGSALAAYDDSQVEEFLRLVAGTKGRWIGIHQGHHYLEHGDGTTSDTRIAEALDAPFLGDSALSRLTFARSYRGKAKSTKVKFDIYSTHGTGSGQTQAAPLAKLEKISGAVDADLYLINHYARKGAVPRDKLFMDQKGRLQHKTIYMVATGGYMAAYEEGSNKAGRAQGSYVEKAMLTPTTLGGTIIRLTPERSQKDLVSKHAIRQEVTL